MRDLNKAMIIGRLTADPEVRTTPNGQNVATFSVATNLRWKGQDGQMQEKVEFHNVVAWRQLADIISQYLKKGARVYIEGRLQTRSWEGKDDGVKRYRTEINAENMIMLDSRAQSEAGNPAAAGELKEEPVDNKPKEKVVEKKEASSDDEEEISIEDIPF